MIALPVYVHEVFNKGCYGFVFSEQPGLHGTPPLAAAMDEDIQEVEQLQQGMHYDDELYDESGSQSDIEERVEALSSANEARGLWWIPLATPKRLFFHNTKTREST